MDSEQIRQAVLAVIAEIAPEADVRGLRPEQSLRRQVDLDSMDWLNVLAGIGERLGMAIPDGDAARLGTLQEIVAYLAARLRAQQTESPPAGAPAALPCTHRLVNGVDVTLRPMHADDLPLEADFVHHLSPQARYERFMVTVNELSPAKLRYLTDVDQVRHVALVATAERDGRQAIVGVVRYIVDPAGTSCEFAIALDDGWHGTGLAGVLMKALIEVARARGLRTMEGIVLATNTAMLHFAHQLGFSAQRDPEERDTVRVLRTL